jgi:hypothetical protein
MAWTTPASYAVSEVLAAAKLNTHVRDQLRYLKGLDGAVALESDVSVGLGTGTRSVSVNGAAAAWRSVNYLTNSSSRWIVGANPTPEGGANTGSDYAIGRYTDAGAFVDSVLTLTRATGAALFADTISVASTGGTGLGGVWMDAAPGTHRAFTGLTSGGVSPWRVFSSALGGDVFTLNLNTGDGALSGSLQVAGACFVTGTANLNLDATTGDLIARKQLRPVSDNTLSLGVTGLRWTAVWAANGSIQTSSRATKQILGVVNPAEAMASLRGLPVYRFHYLKGDGEADTDFVHTGPMAEEMPAGMMVQPGAVSGQSTAGYLTAALLDVDARLAALEAKQQEAA